MSEEEETITKKLMAKKLRLPKEKEGINVGDIITKAFPKCELNLLNNFGELIIESITLTLTKPADYNGMRFFYKKLLPLIAPPEVIGNGEEEPRKKKYVG